MQIVGIFATQLASLNVAPAKTIAQPYNSEIVNKIIFEMQEGAKRACCIVMLFSYLNLTVSS